MVGAELTRHRESRDFPKVGEGKYRGKWRPSLPPKTDLRNKVKVWSVIMGVNSLEDGNIP